MVVNDIDDAHAATARAAEDLLNLPAVFDALTDFPVSRHLIHKELTGLAWSFSSLERCNGRWDRKAKRPDYHNNKIGFMPKRYTQGK